MSTTDPTLSQMILAILKASRPAGWVFGPILFGIGLIHSRSIPKNATSLLAAAAQVFSLSLPLCIIVFGVNDVYDYDSDIRNPRKMVSGPEGGVLSPVYHSSVRLAAWLSTLLILLISLNTRRSQNFRATALLVFLGWQYSAIPLRLKGLPVLDSLSNGLIVFLAWFVGYSFGGGRIATAPGKGYVLALCTAGVHALGAVVDIESDVAAGQTTIATFLGHRHAAMFGAFAYGIALLIEEDTVNVFSVYLWGGLAIMSTPCLRVQLAHQAFKTIVYWTVGMVVIWFGSKALAPRR